METNITEVNYKEYGIEESKAQEIKAQFTPMLDKMVELEKEANEVFALDITDPLASHRAKQIRLKYVKVRTGTAEIHKTQKEFYLKAGKFIDGWKNAQLFASQGIEEKLKAIEDHAENLEKKRIADLQELREGLVLPYVEDITGIDFGNMADDVFEAYLSAKKQAKTDRENAEKEAAEIQRAIERRNMRHTIIMSLYGVVDNDNQTYTLENKLDEKMSNIIDRATLLDAEQEQFDGFVDEFKSTVEDNKEYEKKIEAENEKLKKEAEEKELALAKEREANEKVAAEQKELADKKLKAEQDAREKAEKELADKKAAEQKEAKDKADAEAKLKKEPVKKQMIVWVDSFELPFSEIDNDITAEIKLKFDSFKKWAKEQTEKL